MLQRKPVILTVDDTPDILELFTRLIVAADYTAISAANGKEAMEALERCHINLALLDMNLPDTNGLELAEIMLEQNIPFLILTADASQSTVKRALNLKALNYLVKPVSRQDFHAAINSALNVSKEIRHQRRIQEEIKPQSNAKTFINQAIGILIERHRLTSAGAAMQFINNKATTAQRDAEDIAKEMVEDVLKLNQKGAKLLG